MANALPTRHRKERPKTLPIVYEKDGVQSSVEIPAGDHPGHMVAIKYKKASLLSGIDARSLDGNIDIIYNRDKADAIRRKGYDIFVSGSFDPFIVARSLAKIAHCLAVSHFGLDGFTPYLPKLILGEDTQPWKYVGCATENLITNAAGHEFSIGIELDETDTNVIIILLRLFSNFSPSVPTYQIVTGKLNELTISRLHRPFFAK